MLGAVAESETAREAEIVVGKFSENRGFKLPKKIMIMDKIAENLERVAMEI